MRYIHFAIIAVIILSSGCTSFEISLKVSGCDDADIALHASAVEAVTDVEAGQVVSHTARTVRVKLKEGETSFSLPFIPGEMLVSIMLKGEEGVVLIESAETAHGETVYNTKPVNAIALDWQVKLTPKDTKGLEIEIAAGK